MAEKNGKAAGLLGSIFPPKYDFYGMLTAQAGLTRDGVKALNDWLAKEDLSIQPQEVEEIEQRGDETRRHMEGMLLKAFTTPFDRQDIYSFSRQMDHILNFCLSTAIEMRAFQVAPDVPIASMALNLQRGSEKVLNATQAMATDPARAESMIHEMRQAERDIENAYVASLATLFSSTDPIDAMKKREVYHHLKDAGRALSITIDILHRVIVGLA
jgi:predicted phosphate transport protein (TIGR00153 family)